MTALDALADVIAARLGRGPTGAPLPQLPELPFPPEELPDLLPRTRLVIQGLEFTQSTQHYGTGFGAENSVPLVALKPMVVRAYPFVRQGLLASADTLTGQRVTGELVLTQWNKEVYRTGPTRAEGARLGAAGELDRTLWDEDLTFAGGAPSGGIVAQFRLVYYNAPLNFYVPAWYLRPGRMEATVRLQSKSGAWATRSETFTLLDVPAPRIAIVRVNWRDAAGAVTSPSDADMLATTRLAERMLPFPYFETTILNAEETRSGAFAMAVASGACNTAWNDLLTTLAVTRIFTALFQLGSIVFGFVPTAAIPPGGGTINSGCGRGTDGVGGGFVGFDETFAHELGHIYNRPHVAVPGNSSNDPAYPNYGGDRRSIGEVGIDTGAWPTTPFDPASSDDIMSYGNNLWISPYTYQRIFDARGNHQSASADPRRVRPILVVAFRLYRLARGGEAVELKTSHLIAAAGVVQRITDRASAVSVDLIDANERIIATHHCFAARSHASCGCCGGGEVPEGRAPWLDFEEAIEWPQEAQVVRLAFHRGAEPIASIEVGEPPRLEFEGPRFTEAGLELVLRAAHPRETPKTVVLFSGNDGATWVPVVFDPPDGEPFVVEPRRLRGGERCRFRAVATAELASAERETETFALDPVGRGLFLRMTPRDCAPQEVELSAFVDARGLGAVSWGDVVWSSDREGELGRGFDLSVRLTEGHHEITARIPDGIGGTLAERGIIIVGGRPVGRR